MPVRTISSRELGELLVQQPDLPLIDVRTPAEFRAAHVAGAKNLPLDQLSASRLEAAVGAGQAGTVYFICKGGTRSHGACRKAHAFGLTDIVNVEGGTDDCIGLGLPIRSGRKAISLDRQVRITAGTMILAGAVLAITIHPYWLGLSAFVGAGLLFSGVSDTCAMGDMLAKMPWNR